MILAISQAIPLIAAYVGMITAFGALMYRFLRRHSRQHKNEMSELAREFGFTYKEKDEFGLVGQLRDFDLLRNGNKKGVKHLISGELHGVPVHLFEYSYVVYTGKTAVVISQTVFFAQNKNWYLPAFKIKPETWWHKVLHKIGAAGKDINFPENPEFSGKFWLTGAFEDQIRKVFGYDLQRFLTERPPVHVEGNNYFLIAYKPGKVLNKDEAEVFLSHCNRLVELFREEGEKFELLDLAELKKEAPESIAVSLKKDENL